MTSLCAVAIGNPSSPSLIDKGFNIPDTSWWNLRFGFCEEFTLNQRYSGSSHHQISHVSLRSQAQALSATWNIRERLDLQVILGWGDVHSQWQHNDSLERVRAPHSFYWNVGSKLILFQVQNSVLGVDMRGGGWYNPGQLISLFWQASVAFSQQIGFFCPYVGVSLQEETLYVNSLHFDSHFRKGPFGGCTFSNGSYLFFNMEACGWIETALSFSCEIRI